MNSKLEIKYFIGKPENRKKYRLYKRTISTNKFRFYDWYMALYHQGKIVDWEFCLMPPKNPTPAKQEDLFIELL